MISIKNICIIGIAAMILFSCDLPQGNSVTKSRQELLESVKTRANDDFLWDTGKSDRQIYTGFAQINSRWLCGRISKKHGKLWWFNTEGASPENLANELYPREQNYEGIILKKVDRDTYVFDDTEYPDMNEKTATYYKGLKFVYKGNGELESYINNQIFVTFRTSY